MSNKEWQKRVFPEIASALRNYRLAIADLSLEAYVDMEPRSVNGRDPLGSDSRPNLLCLLAQELSGATFEAYKADLADFFGGELSPSKLEDFVSLPREELIGRLENYRVHLRSQDLQPSTINRRLVALRAVIRCAYRNGRASFGGDGLIKGDPSATHTRRPALSASDIRRIVELPGTDSERGLRDTAILRLMCGSAFRTSEIVSLNVGDFSISNSSLTLQSNYRTETLPINSATAYMIAAYLTASGHGRDPDAPLFCNMDHRPQYRGRRLTAKGVQHLVHAYGMKLGVNISASMLRTAAIRTALNATGGDIERVRKFSRVTDPRGIAELARQNANGLNPAVVTDGAKSLRQRATAALARSYHELKSAQQAVERTASLPKLEEFRIRSRADLANPD